MRKLIFLCLFFAAAGISQQPDVPPAIAQPKPGGVSAPSLLYKVEPSYTEEARQAHIEGTVVLYVEVDPSGKAVNPRVVRSVDPGLDQKAIEAVAKWIFRPGYKDGKPVTVAATIEVNFRLLKDPPLVSVPAPPSPWKSAEEADAAYLTLVERVKGGDFTIDFRSLRMACIKSSLCKPRGTGEELQAILQAEKDHLMNRLIGLEEARIEQGFVDIEAHAECSAAYAEISEPEKAKFHRDVVTALMRSILNTGDGKTKEKALEVISDREEYMMLTAMGLPSSGPAIVSRSVITEGPHAYDRWFIQKPPERNAVELFFNIDNFSPTKSRASRSQ
jgi:TonB family protein